MRKPGLVPLTKPAPLDEVTTVTFLESDLGLIIAEDDPILWVRLNEAAGETVNEQHFVGNATVNGAPTRQGLGEGFYFDGTDDSVFIGCDQLTNVPGRLLEEAGEFTVEALLSSEYVGSEGGTKILRWGSYGVELRAYKFAGSNDSGYLSCSFYDSDALAHTVEHYDASLWVPGVQMHVAATYDGANLKLYIDGVEVEDDPETAVVHWGYSNDATNGLGIATDGPFGGSFYKGKVGEVAIYSTPLSAARILEHAEANREATLFNVALVDDWGTPEALASASSFFMDWEDQTDDTFDPDDIDLFVKASGKLTIPTTPSVEDTYFWAIQVDFYDDVGSKIGAAHTGLQWIASHPSSKAVNWGGYSDITASEFEGTVSDFPSTPDNDNSRDYAWETNTEYTFEIYSVGDGFWRATVNGIPIRDLEVPDSAFISNPLCFSEVFAACDDPSHSVKWRDLYLYDAADNAYEITTINREFQVDGCSNTDTVINGGYWEMITNTTRAGGGTVMSMRGDIRYQGLYPDYWPDGEVANEMNWSVKITDFPYGSYQAPYLRDSIEFVDTEAEYVDALLSIDFFWDDELDVFNTIRISGYFYDEDTEEEYSLSEVGTAVVDEVFSDAEFMMLDFQWSTGATYDMQVKLNGSTWEIRIDDTLIFTFPDYSMMAGVQKSGFEMIYFSVCNDLKAKAGFGNVSALSGSVTLVMDELFVNLDSTDCDDENAYVDTNDFFTTENNVPKTIAGGGETLTI